MHPIKSIQTDNRLFYPTAADVTRWFNIVNSYIFDDQLTPFDNIVIKRTYKIWACVLHDDEKNTPISIRIHMKFPNKMQFVNVLAHEMVHKWQLEINHDTGWHNKHFFSWRPKFNENGLDLNRKA